MSVDPKPSDQFARLRQAARKRGPLSFEALSASLNAAQAETGFVDTLAVEGQATSAQEAVVSTSDREALEPSAALARSPAPPSPETRRQRDEDPGGDHVATPQTAAADPRVSPAPPKRKGRVRAPFVQCNLKLAEELRDALHLQALRERRPVADLVTEVMTAYLTTKGTFDRLR